jgi:hypothetical protein
MPLADRFRIEKKAKEDLAAIGGEAKRYIIFQLLRLPRLPPSRCPPMAWQKDGEPERRRFDIGRFTARFVLEVDPAGETVAAVERVFEREAVDEFERAQIEAAEARAAKFPPEDQEADETAEPDPEP